MSVAPQVGVGGGAGDGGHGSGSVVVATGGVSAGQGKGYASGAAGNDIGKCSVDQAVAGDGNGVGAGAKAGDGVGVDGGIDYLHTMAPYVAVIGIATVDGDSGLSVASATGRIRLRLDISGRGGNEFGNEPIIQAIMCSVIISAITRVEQWIGCRINHSTILSPLSYKIKNTALIDSDPFSKLSPVASEISCPL